MTNNVVVTYVPPIPLKQAREESRPTSSESLARRRARSGDTAPVRSAKGVAYELGLAGKPAPLWILVDYTLIEEPVYGSHVATICQHWYKVDGHKYTQKPGVYQKAYNAGLSKRAKAEKQALQVSQEEALRKLCQDLGMPQTRETLDWLKRQSSKGTAGV